MKTIKLTRREYKGKTCIFIKGERDSLFETMIRAYPGRTWSQSNRTWYIEDKEGSFRELVSYFRGSFKIDTTGLHQKIKPVEPGVVPFVPDDIPVVDHGFNRYGDGGYGPVEMRISQSDGRLIIKFMAKFNPKWIDELKQYGRPWYDKDKREWILYASRITIDSLTDYFSRQGIDLRVKRVKQLKSLTVARDKIGKEIRERPIGEESERALTILRSYLREKRFSQNTITTYLALLDFFLRYYNTMTPSEIGLEEISAFMENHVIKYGYSVSYQNQMITAIKTYYTISGSPDTNFENIKRPRRGRTLPQVFSREEVTRILNAPRNIKHKLLLWMVYSCGLRRSEVTNITLNDLNRERNVLHIRGGKGNKDRVVPVSNLVWGKIEEYISAYQPDHFLFEGQTGNRYTSSSVYNVFKNALARVGIDKEVGIHSLRHSYATHLHENGLDIRYIQELLGHKNSKTTEIYTHVSRRNLVDIKSPIEDLDLH